MFFQDLSDLRVYVSSCYIPEVDDSKLNATTKPMAQEFGKAIYEFRANCWFNNINNIRNNAPCGVIYIKLFLYCLLYKKKGIFIFFDYIYIIKSLFLKLVNNNNNNHPYITKPIKLKVICYK